MCRSSELFIWTDSHISLNCDDSVMMYISIYDSNVHILVHMCVLVCFVCDVYKYCNDIH